MASPAKPRYGESLQIVGDLGIGPCMDAAVAGGHLYVLGGDALFTADISDPGSPTLVSRLSGLGNVRQIQIQGTTAYITARADGVAVVDVADPVRPRLLSRYDSVEMATGVAVAGDLLLIANRNYGVELVDVADPEAPQHLSTVRTGEAQSVCVRGDYLYAGIWAEAKLATADIRDPYQPAVTSRQDLGGFGDGVFTDEHYVYAATGPPSSVWRDLLSADGVLRTRADRGGQPVGASEGHGLEIFDRSCPAEPKRISRASFPDLGLRWREADWWSVTVAGGYAFCADSCNGIFVVDVRDARNPACIAHRQFHYSDDPEKTAPVGRLSVADDHIYVPGCKTDLHVLSAPGIATRADRGHAGLLRRIPPRAPTPSPNEGCRLYRPPGQVRAVACFDDGTAAVACGKAGMRLVRLWPDIEELAVADTGDRVHGVSVAGSLAFAAEGSCGLSVWEYDSRSDPPLRLCGRYRPADTIISQVYLPVPGRYAFVQKGTRGVALIDMSDPARPEPVLERGIGFSHDEQLCPQLVSGRYLCAYSNHGLFWFDLEVSPPTLVANRPRRLAYGSHVWSLGNRVLINRDDGYLLASPDDGDESRMEYCYIGRDVVGKPSVYSDTLLLSDRPRGLVCIVDVKDIHHPKLIARLQTPGNPGRSVLHNGSLVVPDGYEGLRVYDRLDPDGRKEDHD